MLLTGLDQLWVADITDIRLRVELVCLVVILDAFLGKRFGWALDRTVEDDLTLVRPCVWPCNDGSRKRAWCNTPIAACNTSHVITTLCYRRRASASA